MLTEKERKEVERIRNSQGLELKRKMTDEEVLAQARFVETGEGIDVYDSVEAFKAAKAKLQAAENTDEIEEV